MRRLAFNITWKAAGIGLLATGMVARGAAGCSDNPVQATPDAGELDAAVDVKLDRNIQYPDRVEVPEEAGVFECGIPGFIRDSAYSVNSGFCAPRAKEFMPPPIAWEPCPATAPIQAGCRWMQHDWDISAASSLPYITNGFGYSRAGKPVLSFSRYTKAGNLRMVGELDGPTRFALLETDFVHYVAQHEAIGGDVVTYRVYDSEVKRELSSEGGGAIFAKLDDLHPTAMARFPANSNNGSVFASDLGPLAMANGKVTQYDASTGAFVRDITTGPDEGGAAIPLASANGYLFWDILNSSDKRLRMFSPATGKGDFVTFAPDRTRGAADIGTDGVDMVWTEASGGVIPGEYSYPVNSVMTAKFEPDAAKRVVRRIGSTGRIGFTGEAYRVGCGYAIHDTGDMPNAPTTKRLFRLSDGHRWEIPVILPYLSPGDWQWGALWGVTCDEIILNAFDRRGLSKTPREAPVQHLVRLRIDSLGPGMPAN
jgi:hypothetical protein